jgi:hypothetical protein
MPGNQTIKRPVRASFMGLQKMMTKNDKNADILKQLVGIIEEQEAENNSKRSSIISSKSSRSSSSSKSRDPMYNKIKF